MTGMWTLSFTVPGLMMMSMPGLSFLVTISIFAVVLRLSSFPFARILYAPSGTSWISAISSNKFFSILSIFFTCPFFFLSH